MDAMNSEFCICCRRSLKRIGSSRRRSYCLTKDFVLTHPELIVYFAKIAINKEQLCAVHKICRPCLQRAQRCNAAVDPLAEIAANQLAEVAADQLVEITVNLSEEVIADDYVAANQCQNQTEKVNLTHTKLPGYKRAPYNTHTCIIAGCNNRNLQKINNDKRAIVLQEKCFFIPCGSRICQEHSIDQVWQDIDSKTRKNFDEFSPKYLKEMMDMLRNRKV